MALVLISICGVSMFKDHSDAFLASQGNCPLAIVGIGCRFPGSADDVNSFWKMLAEGRSGIGEVPKDRWDLGRHYDPDPSIPGMMISNRGGFIDILEKFDARFWGLSPREAMRMDPQQRWLLEVAWEALEDSGTAPQHLRGTKVGVFVGIAGNDYALLQMPYHKEADAYTNSGNTASIASNRISYLLDLRGPSTSVDTACSSGLVATWLACRSIWSGSCTAALAGGVNALITPHASIGFSRAAMLSPSGQCFAFDARANGYVRAEGAGMVYVKTLEQALADQDRIYAVIRAAVVNQDGHTSSMTVPSVEGQAEMLRQAYQEAGLSPGSVVYIEAHGTGTPVGDPIEVTAIGQVLREGRQPGSCCLIGSVKTNIGHLEAGSGLAGLIKAALVLHKDAVPPCCNFETPNPHIPFDAFALEVATRLQPLPHLQGLPPVVGVNSFGFGGTNSHVVLEAAPPVAKKAAVFVESAIRPHVLPISARDEVSLRHYVELYRNFLADPALNLADVCYSAGARKEHHDHQIVVLGNDAEGLRGSLEIWLRGKTPVERLITGTGVRTRFPLTFVFTGQGGQWWAMGRQLLEREPVFRRTVQNIEALLQPLAGFSLIEEMTRGEQDSRIDRTDVAQPTIFAVQVGLYELWKSWGIQPSKVVGHSVGEVAAALCAGIYSLEDAVKIIFHRSRLQNMTGGHGRMLAAGITAREARELIGEHIPHVQIAVFNSPTMVTLAGDTQPLENIANHLQDAGKFHRWLRINYAFHTHQMEPIRDELLAVLADIQPRSAQVPFTSTVTGGLLDGEQLDNLYWWRNVRQPVLFGPAIANLMLQGESTFLELGPHPALASSINEYAVAQGRSASVFHSLRRNIDESIEMLTNMAGLFMRGQPINWATVNQSSGAFVALPRYPWNRESFWLESKTSAHERLAPAEHPLLGLRVAAAQPTWQFSLHPGRYAYLNDHQFWDSIVFPGAGYGEIGLALARLLFPDEPHAVEDLEIKKALLIDAKQPPTVQIVFNPDEKSFAVCSALAASDDWELHAQGRLTRVVPAEVTQVDLAQLREALPDHFDHDQYYAELAATGYQFGPNFQQLQNVWHTKGEALAEIVVPDAVVKTVNQYHFHPAVLDACFHISKGVQIVHLDALPKDYFYLPQAIRRIRLECDKPPTHLWAHARLTKYDGHSLVSDIFVYDKQGRRVAEIRGLRVDRVEQKQSADDPDNCYYQFWWDRCRLPRRGIEKPCLFASGSEILRAVREQVPEIYRQYALDQYQHEFIPRIKSIAAQFVQNAWLDLGWDLRVGDRFTSDAHIQNLGIIGAYHRLGRSQIHSLSDQGFLRQVAVDTWEVVRAPRRTEMTQELAVLASEYPRFSAEVELHMLTGPHLATILTGATDPLQLLFPDGSVEMLERFYAKGSDLPAYNHLMQLAVSRAIASVPDRRALRILEVGAGTGSFTHTVLPTLPAEQTEYTFSDVEPFFLEAAKSQFAEYSGVDYLLFDLERDPASQGFTPGTFDLILASDVLHATCDLRKTLLNLRACLAPGGLLMFLEALPRRHGWNGIFGLLADKRHYADTQLRTDSPFLDRPRWETLLTDCGFENVASFGCHVNESASEQAVFIAYAPAEANTPVVAESPALPAATGYVVFGDQSGVADRLIGLLRGRGSTVVRVLPGTEFRQTDLFEFTMAVDSPDDMRRLLSEASTATNGLAGVVHCWNLDHPAPATLDTQHLSEAQRTGVLNALCLVQAESALPPQVWFVTRNVYYVQSGDPADGLASSPLVGLLRVANNELSQCRLTMVDFDLVPPEELSADLLQEVIAADGETEVAYRGGLRSALRLQRVRVEDMPVRTRNAVGSDGSLVPYRLETNNPGILTNLILNETRRREPGPGEIEIRVRAGGVNFRDVMKALGTYPGNPIDVLWFGDDVAGVVERVGADVRHLAPGDEVVGMAPYAFRSFVTVDARMVFRKPRHLSFEQAATVPTVFLTAHYALQHLARMQPGERVLIHAGAGGVGQAAIQIAKRLGLEIFATAGSEEKRRLLRDLGAHHVMNSRTLEFADQIQEITAGRGVDAVLNSLAGDFIPKSMSVLAPFGRFLEIGKIDIYKNSKIGLEPLRNNISYFVIDLAQHLIYKPDYMAQLFVELGELFANGEYHALPYSIFPITKVVDAFRYMAQGKHIGKIVLSFEADEIPIGPCTEDEHRFRHDATYLITGGAGGFGWELAKWMVRRGARHLVLSSRSGPSEEASRDIEQLRAAGITVVDARCDVTNCDDVTRLVRQIRDELPPLRGVIHGAMVLDDEFLNALDATRFRKALDPKMLGAWNLHAATQGIELDHFIGFSSFSSVIGGPKQSNYNAGNYFLEALAHYRHAQGLPAETISWGALLGAGFVERNKKTAQYLDKVGMKAFNIEEALRVFGRLTQLDPVQIAASRADWRAISKASPALTRGKTYAALTHESGDREGGGSILGRMLAVSPDARPRVVEDFLLSQVAGVFGADASKLDRDTPLTSFGLDSLMAIELANRIELELGMGIPMGTLLNGPSITALAQTVMRLLAPRLAGDAESGVAESLSIVAAPLEKLEIPHEEFPLSEEQQAIWRRAQLAPESSVCHRVFSAKFTPSLDVAALKKAFASLPERHPMLNVVFRETHDQVVQRLDKSVGLDFRELDLSASAENHVTGLLAREVYRPFDLHHGPLTRLSVIHTPNQGLWVVFTIHQIIADSASVSILLQDLLQAYSAIVAGLTRKPQPQAYTFADFVAWERKQLDGPVGARNLEFWKRELQDAPQLLNLHTNHPRPKVASLNGADFGFTLDDELSHQAFALCAEQDVSLFTTLLAAFEILLHRESLQRDLLVGTSLTGRQQRELQPLVGCFDNFVAIRSRINDDPTCADLLQRTSQHVSAARDNQQFPLSRLIEQFEMRADEDRPPLVQVAFLLERSCQDQHGISACLLGHGGHRFHWGEIAVEAVDCPTPVTSYEITLAMEEAGGRIYGCWRYKPDLFSADTIERLHAGFTAALEQIARNPLQRVSCIVDRDHGQASAEERTKGGGSLPKLEQELDDVFFWKRVSEAGGNLDVDEYLHQKAGAQLLNRAFNGLVQFMLDGYISVKVECADRLPKPPFILTPNHTSHLDTLSLYYALGKELQGSLAVLAAQDYFFKNKLMGYFFKSVLKTIPVGRSGDFLDGLNCAKQLVDRGRIVLIFPEGTRSVTGALQPFKPGIGLLVSMLDVPIIPVKLIGPYDLWPKGRSTPKRGMVTVRFGMPYVVPSDITRKRLDYSSFQRIAKDLHRVIAAT